MRALHVTALLGALLFSCSLFAALGSFERHIYENGRGALPYRLFLPKNYDRTRTYPLVVWLHGGGGEGLDNEKQIAHGNTRGATVWTLPANQRRFPAIVVAPQCPEHEMWTTVRPNVTSNSPLRNVVGLVEELQRTYSIDPDRIYVAGQTTGAYAVWALLADHPRMFAAAVELSGGGDETKAVRMKNVPVWAFHGDLDREVPVKRSRAMVAALRRAGGQARYTEYKGVDRRVWNRAFAEAELLPWLFAQRRQVP